MNWQDVIKTSESYWKPAEQSWSFCGMCCLGKDSKSVSSQPRVSSYTKERRITHYWSKEDDLKLIKLASKYKQDWERVSEKFPDKSPAQLSSRWKNKLDPSLKKTSWTDEEDIVLKTFVLEFGYNWERLAKYLKGRSEQDIKKRFNTSVLPSLNQHELIQLQEALNPTRHENGSSMDIDVALAEGKEEYLNLLNKRVDELQVVMKETLDQIERLESDLYDSQNLLS
jgi:hypothetical protein